ADLGEPIERGRIQERERKRSLPYGGGHPVERHAGQLKAVHPTRLARVTPGERASRGGPQDPQLDQPVDVAWIDAGPPGHLLARVLTHGKAIVAVVRPSVRRGSYRWPEKPSPEMREGSRVFGEHIHSGAETGLAVTTGRPEALRPVPIDR